MVDKDEKISKEENIKLLAEILKKQEDVDKKVLDEDLEDDEIDDGVEIFDEDLEGASDDDVSDFSITDTILSSATGVPSWDRQRLEESIKGERMQKDWGGNDEFVGSDIYNVGSSNNFYTSDSSSNDLYQTSGSGQDLYSDSKTSENLYNSVGDGQQGGRNNGYVEQGHIKSYGEIEDSRRSSGRSMLEIAGFEDKEKQKTRDMRKSVRYENEN